MIVRKTKINGVIYEMIAVILLFTLFLSYYNFGRSIVLFKTILGTVLWFHILTSYKYTRRELVICSIIIVYVILFSLMGKGSLQLLMIEFPVAIFLLKKKELNKIIWTIMPITIMVIVMVNWSNSVNHYILFKDISRNYISIFGLYSLSIYNIMLEKKLKHCNIMIIFAYFMICLNAIGRGGIIASGIILVLFIYRKIFVNTKKNYKTIIKIVLFFIVAFILLIMISNNIGYIKITYFGRFFGVENSAEKSTQIRISIVKDYIESCNNSIISFIFGGNAGDYTIVSDNLHNSYLQLHSKFGIIAVAFVIYFSIKSCIFMKKNNLLDSLYIFIGILVRAFFDWMFPSSPIDIILLYYMLLPVFSMKGIHKDE